MISGFWGVVTVILAMIAFQNCSGGFGVDESVDISTNSARSQMPGEPPPITIPAPMLPYEFDTHLPGFTIWDSRGKAVKVADAVPFSFTYGGTPFSVTTWKLQSSGSGKWVYLDPSGVLEVSFTLVVMSDFNALKWVLGFRNVSNKNSQVISNVRPGHLQLIGNSGRTQRFNIHYQVGTLGENPNDGSQASPALSDFSPISNAPDKNVLVSLRSSNGRSSSGTMPYFNIEAPGGGGGLILAIGWSGQWSSTFGVDATGTSLTFQAGQESFALQLRPGETVRTPSILMMPWTGNDIYVGQNRFRRLMLKYFTPLDKNGQVPQAVAAVSNGGSPIPWTQQTSEDLKAMIEKVSTYGLALNTFWVDAGWYPVITPAQDKGLFDALTKAGILWASGVGDWIADPARFPKGYTEVSDAAHAKNYKSLLWFEPERAALPASNYNIFNSRSQLFQSIYNGGTVEQKIFGQFNFSDGNNVQQMADMMSDRINTYKLDIFRQDMNGNGPLPFWKLNDANQSKGMGIQRTGATEAGYIEGLYRFWDILRARHPNLLIDNCAGGGRRLDFEALSRTVPLWRSDRVWEPNGQQDEMAGISLWIPLQGRGTDQFSAAANLTGPERIIYKIRSGYGWMGTFAFSWLDLDPESKAILQKETGAQFGTTSPLGPAIPFSEIFKGDYYPMPYASTAAPMNSVQGSMPDYTGRDTNWVAWQFFRPDLKSGLVQGFRRSTNAPITYQLPLRGLNPTANYKVTDFDSGIAQTVSGSALMGNGISMLCPVQACAKVFTFQEQ